MKRFRLIPAAAGALACATGASASATSSHFDSSNDGWVIANVNPFAHIAVDPASQSAPFDPAIGLPPGSIRIADIYAETFVGAPSSFLGDQAALLSQSVSFDIYPRYADAVPYSAIALRGASATLYWKPQAPPPTNQWVHIDVALDQSANWRINSESATSFATNADILAVLSDLRGLYFRTEWHTGSDDTNIDNVTFGSAAPACAGDINNDGFTNASDFVILAGNFGASVPVGTGGDLNSDGVVNASDFVILAGDFGCVP